ncbi:hypothetical protein O3G_MSEX000646 [Manduca sexta]|nr:hypothetical protein O3G_MSEX000646 [Manduca sexta]
MSQIQLIPKDFLSIIPKYDGDDKLLNLFIKKCEYVLDNFKGNNNPVQQTYAFHSITSRLIGKAAILYSERNIDNWDSLKELLIQHFGDPRSEACIALELESIKIKPQESYIELCHRIQNVRSSLFAKVNLLEDEGLKAAKMIIYNNTAFETFLYNLSDDLINFIRLNKCKVLEEALEIVTEEVNFQNRLKSKKGIKQPSTSTNNAQQSKMPQQTFKFGTPQNNYKGSNNPQFKFGIPNQGMKGPNAIMAQKPHLKPVSQNLPQTVNNYKQSGFFKRNPNQQFKFGIPHAQQTNDVSMRTVRNNHMRDVRAIIQWRNKEKFHPLKIL